MREPGHWGTLTPPAERYRGGEDAHAGTSDDTACGAPAPRRPVVITTVLTWVGVWVGASLVLGLALGFGLRRLARGDDRRNEQQGRRGRRDRRPGTPERARRPPASPDSDCGHSGTCRCEECAGRPEERRGEG